jgi:hypothetical protein
MRDHSRSETVTWTNETRSLVMNQIRDRISAEFWLKMKVRLLREGGKW